MTTKSPKPNMPEQINELNQRIAYLEGVVNILIRQDRYYFRRNLDIDNVNIVLRPTTGTKIGTAITQKLAFWNKTPIVQPTAISAPSAPGGAYSQSEAQSAVTAINSIRTTLSNLGLTA